MKKLIIAFFVLFALAFTGIAAIPVITKIVGPKMLNDVEPPTGLPFGFRDFPIPERSIVAVKLQLPVSAMTNLAAQNMPKKMSGVERKDFHEKVRNGEVHWQMQPGNLSLKNSGRNFTFHLPVTGSANATGKYGLLGIKVKGNARMNGSINGTMTPMIHYDWKITTNMEPAFQVDHAKATFGRMGTFDIKNEVQKTVSPLVEQELAKAGPGLTNALDIKTRVQKLWNQAHVTREMSREPYSWLVFDPGLAQMGPIDYSDPEHVSVTMGMVAQTYITNTETQFRAPESLPQLELVSENPETELRLPIIANLRVLNYTLRNQSFNYQCRFGPTIKISQPEIAIGKKGLLNVGLNLCALSGICGNNLSARVWVQGRPVVDYENLTMGLRDVSLTVETREALSGTTAWLLEEVITKSVENEMRIDLKDHIPELETELHKVVMNSGLIPNNIQMSMDKPKVELLGVYLVERTSWNEEDSPGVVFVLGAKTNIGVKLSNFEMLSLSANY